MNPPTSVVLLIYRSVRWLNFCVAQLNLNRARNRPFKIRVVCNDATPAVIEAAAALQRERLIDSLIIHRSPDPGEYVMARIYRAWNAAMAHAQLAGDEYAILYNSDMVGHGDWVDALVDAKVQGPDLLPTATLVESERVITPEAGRKGIGVVPSSISAAGGVLRSGAPDTARFFGSNPETFRPIDFSDFADGLIKRAGTQQPRRLGRLFMPVLLAPSEWAKAGGYPLQQPNDPLAADAVFFYKLSVECGLRHTEVGDSIVYHFQAGEACDDLNG